MSLRLTALVTAFASLAACQPAREEPVAAAAPAPVAKPLPPVVARCGALDGDVEFRAGEASWAPLSFEGELRAGDRVRTGKLSSARLDYLAGGGFRLDESTGVLLEALPPAEGRPAAALATVEQGEGRGFTERSAADVAAPPFPFRTLEGVRAFLVSENGEPTQLRLRRTATGTEVALLIGEASLEVTGTKHRLSPGQFTVLVSGEPAATQNLLTPPRATGPAPDRRFECLGLVVRLEWEPVAGAAGYHFQVAREPAFQALALTADVTGPFGLFVPKASGRYAWRVAARDRDGRLGDYGEARPLFCEEAAPSDYLLQPEPGAVVRHTGKPVKVLFRWEPAPGTPTYRWVLARTPDLSVPLATRTTSAAEFELEGLDEGEYFWGAYLEDRFPYPLFVAVRPLSVKRLAADRVKATTTLKDWGN